MFFKKLILALAAIASIATISAAEKRVDRNTEDDGFYRSTPNEIPYTLRDPDDDTDALAIPSDTTEWEEEQQMKKLDRLQKQRSKNDSTPRSPQRR